MQTSLSLSLPPWMEAFVASKASHFASLEERMSFVLEMTQKHITEKTGGPFGAAVFEQESGRLVSVGVNRVVPETLSSAHAEVVALSFAQKTLQHYDLGGADMPAHQLVVNAQMCAMCLGAVCWSGVRQVVYGATGNDVESITGFDEGPVPEDSHAALETRGISVVAPFMRDEATQLLHHYVSEGGTIYNGRQAS